MPADSIESLLSWIKAADRVKAIIAVRDKLPPRAIDMQAAAMAKLCLTEPTELLDRIWDVGMLLSLVRDIDFRAWSEYEEVTLHNSILPAGVPRRLDEETIKALGEKWRVHKYDPDPFPSLPHAHNIYHGYTLDLTNGKLYERRKHIGTR